MESMTFSAFPLFYLGMGILSTFCNFFMFDLTESMNFL